MRFLGVMAVIVLSVLLNPSAQALPLTEVEFESNYVFELPGGYNTPATYTGSEINSLFFFTRDDTHDGKVDTLQAYGTAATGWGSNDWWLMSFSTAQMNTNLATGTYNNPGAYPFESPGKAGFSAGITGVGLDPDFPNSESWFKILDFQYDYEGSTGIIPNIADPRVKSFAAEFEVKDRTNDINVVKGHVYYNYEAPSTPPQPTVPEPATMMLMGGGLAAAFARRRFTKSTRCYN